MQSAISIRNISKRFQNTVALDGVTFDIPAGEIFGLLGPNGAGKTTLMRILIGMFAPDVGRVVISDNSNRNLKERIGYLPEERGLYPKMKVKDLLQFCASIKGVSSSELHKRIGDGLERVGLLGQEGKKVSELSKGNQQRVQLLITLLHQPDILILDEPFTALDPIGVDQMKRALIEEAQRGAVVVISTHNMENAEQLCKRIALINRGQLIRCGDLKSIKIEDGQDELIIHYQGSPWSPPDMPDLPCTTLEDSSLHIRLTNGYNAPDLIRRFANHMNVLDVHRVEPTLHDIFVRLVSRQEAIRGYES